MVIDRLNTQRALLLETRVHALRALLRTALATTRALEARLGCCAYRPRLCIACDRAGKSARELTAAIERELLERTHGDPQ